MLLEVKNIVDFLFKSKAMNFKTANPLIGHCWNSQCENLKFSKLTSLIALADKTGQ